MAPDSKIDKISLFISHLLQIDTNFREINEKDLDNRSYLNCCQYFLRND